MAEKRNKQYTLCVIGGAGHVGLPLGVVMANFGVKTVLFDINKEMLNKIKTGIFPFKEKGGSTALKKALKSFRLFISDGPEVISRSEAVLLVVGTPLDEYLNPKHDSILRVIENYFDYFLDGQVLILRSTVFPGTSEMIRRYFQDRNKMVNVAFCPERIVEGMAIEELTSLPQIVSAFDDKTVSFVTRLFKKITPKKIIVLNPIEAELAKLFSNAWRYIKFAAANSFYMLAETNGLNYHKIDLAMKEDYRRMQDLPSPGFAAGPCLLKDTMQLAAFYNHNFFLGHAAMLVNEGLPNFIVNTLKSNYKLFIGSNANKKTVATLTSVSSDMPASFKDKSVGILGMAFKAESDDKRDSLAYKLKKILMLFV